MPRVRRWQEESYLFAFRAAQKISSEDQHKMNVGAIISAALIPLLLVLLLATPSTRVSVSFECPVGEVLAVRHFHNGVELSCERETSAKIDLRRLTFVDPSGRL